MATHPHCHPEAKRVLQNRAGLCPAPHQDSPPRRARPECREEDVGTSWGLCLPQGLCSGQGALSWLSTGPTWLCRPCLRPDLL